MKAEIAVRRCPPPHADRRFETAVKQPLLVASVSEVVWCVYRIQIQC
jgi:hypothetical protein